MISLEAYSSSKDEFASFNACLLALLKDAAVPAGDFGSIPPTENKFVDIPDSKLAFDKQNSVSVDPTSGFVKWCSTYLCSKLDTPFSYVAVPPVQL